MYGSQTLVSFTGKRSFADNIYGASFGIGWNQSSIKYEASYSDFGLVIPLASDRFRYEIDLLKQSTSYSGFSASVPILLCVGYNIGI